MSGTVAYVWADADIVDIRRFCGYPLYGTGVVIFPEPWFYRYYLALEARLAAVTPTEAAVVQTSYLSNLRTLENAIPAASTNLDTDQAAVWTHNKQEVSDRRDLFDDWRRRLCEFLGIPAGPFLRKTGTSIRVVI